MMLPAIFKSSAHIQDSSPAFAQIQRWNENNSVTDATIIIMRLQKIYFFRRRAQSIAFELYLLWLWTCSVTNLSPRCYLSLRANLSAVQKLLQTVYLAWSIGSAVHAGAQGRMGNTFWNQGMTVFVSGLVWWNDKTLGRFCTVDSRKWTYWGNCIPILGSSQGENWALNMRQTTANDMKLHGWCKDKNTTINVQIRLEIYLLWRPVDDSCNHTCKAMHTHTLKVTFVLTRRCYSPLCVPPWPCSPT